ncbi:MAG: ABC transporter permease subunit [Deltaproteobacteria bacterium]|nr:ABC transporter permease subunit [Deltaproteobacteria bacterium]
MSGAARALLVCVLLGAAGVRAETPAAEFRWGADSQGGAPYIFQDPMDPNHLIGFEVELADALAERMGQRARPVPGPWDRLLELLNRGDFDAAINGMEVADEKLRVCALSRPYYVAVQRLTVRADARDAPATVEGLKDWKVGTLPGSLAERALERVGAATRTYEGGQDEMFDDLRLGRTDAVLTDEPIAMYYGGIDRALRVLPGAYGEVRYAAAVRRDDGAQLAAINTALDALARDGTLRRIYSRWGLYNAATAALLGDPGGRPSGVAEAWEAWRTAVGTPPPFWERLRDRYPALLPAFVRGAWMTVVVSLAAMVLAVLLGMALALCRWRGNRALRWTAVAYIEFFRGTPLLIQLTMIYFGLPELGVRLDPLASGILALGLNYAAAEAENYRAGLESVPAGQAEVARTLGFTGWQSLRLVIGPQALRVSLPPSTNDFIALLKDSSLVSLVTLTELTKTYVNLANATRDHLGLGVVVAAAYLLLGLPAARLARYLEGRLGAHLATGEEPR